MGTLARLNSLFAELRRRHVFRVAAVYGFVGWVVIQVVTQVFPVLLLPDWLARAVVVLVLVGFPIALVLAWALEVTPDGVRRTGSPFSQSRGSGGPPSRNSGARLALVALLVAAAIAGGSAFFARGRPESPGARPAVAARSDEPETIRSIAVLPFVNMSSDEENEHFSSGMTEELLNALAQVRGLRVAARTSSFAFKGKNADIREIGDKLGVESVLEGSVRKAGNRIKITAQLIDADSGYHIWSETYERELQDVFAIQEDISSSIVRSLLPKLAAGPDSAPPRPQLNLRAYELYLKGRHLVDRAQNESEVRQAMAYFERAAAADPGYAAAQVGLATGYWKLSGPPSEKLPRMRLALQRALRLDDANPEAHFWLAVIQYVHDWDFVAAERSFRRSMELNPLFAGACGCYAIFLHQIGRDGEALQEAERARALDPLSADRYVFLAQLYMVAGRDTEARAQLRTASTLDSTLVSIPIVSARGHARRGHRAAAIHELDRAYALWRRLSGGKSPIPSELAAALGYLYGATGESRNAERLLEELKTRAERGYLPAEHVAAIAAGLGRNDEALQWLERAYSERSWVTWFPHVVRVIPGAETLRRDPRYQEWLDRIGFPAGGR